MNKTASDPATMDKDCRQVIIAIANGLTAKEIAARLNITVKRVDLIRQNLKHRYGLATTAGIVRFAVSVKTDALIKRWRADAEQYKRQLEELRAKQLPHEQHLSMMTCLRSCALGLEEML